jgi:hypothetical protein
MIPEHVSSRNRHCEESGNHRTTWQSPEVQIAVKVRSPRSLQSLAMTFYSWNDLFRCDSVMSDAPTRYRIPDRNCQVGSPDSTIMELENDMTVEK